LGNLGNRKRDVCPALFRFFGFLGFMVFGLGTMSLGIKIFHLDIDLWNFSLSTLGKKGIILTVVSFLLAFIGMIIGWGIGVGIRIRNKRVADIINTLWHYGANGSIIWVTLFSMAFTLILGKEGAKEFLLLFGPLRFFLILISISVIASWLIGIAVFLISRIIIKRDEVSYALSWLVSIIIGLFMSTMQSRIFDISILYGIGIGFLFPIFLIPITNYTQMRDEQTRDEL